MEASMFKLGIFVLMWPLTFCFVILLGEFIFDIQNRIELMGYGAFAAICASFMATIASIKDDEQDG